MACAQVKDGKKPKFKLGVFEPKLGSIIQETTSVPCMSNDVVGEVLRGIRQHFARYVDGVSDTDIKRAQLGLAHSYSRAKVKFNVNKVDNMIIQAIALLDTLDKDVNTFVMRVREWYSWHFPELVKIVNDNYLYSRVVLIIKDKSTLTEEKLPQLTEALADEVKAKEVRVGPGGGAGGGWGVGQLRGSGRGTDVSSSSQRLAAEAGGWAGRARATRVGGKGAGGVAAARSPPLGDHLHLLTYMPSLG